VLVHALGSANRREIMAAAEKALDYVQRMIVADDGERSQELAFALCTFAEKVCPGAVYDKPRFTA
jgi:hypothetical protein